MNFGNHGMASRPLSSHQSRICGKLYLQRSDERIKQIADIIEVMAER